MQKNELSKYWRWGFFYWKGCRCFSFWPILLLLVITWEHTIHCNIARSIKIFPKTNFWNAVGILSRHLQDNYFTLIIPRSIISNDSWSFLWLCLTAPHFVELLEPYSRNICFLFICVYTLPVCKAQTQNGISCRRLYKTRDSRLWMTGWYYSSLGFNYNLFIKKIPITPNI